MKASCPGVISKFLSFVALGTLCLSGLALPNFAEAKARKPKAKLTIVRPSDTFTVDVTVKSGKKTMTEELYCYKKEPGRVTQTRRGLSFTPLSKILQDLRAKKKQNTKNYKLLAKMQKQAAGECKNPKFLALEKHKGAFGDREARLLFERFAFGGSPEQIQRAVQIGLEATVRELTTYTSDPVMNAQFEDIVCDTYLANNPWTGEADDRNETCNPWHPNDLRADGMRKALEWRFAYSKNPFFDRLWFWIHDERLAVNSSVVGYDEMHALRTYVRMVDDAARTGDYKQYMREANTDHLLALDWLDGAVNRGFSPNENWAREFWELGTVGAADLDGRPNYTSFDIAQAALAHSGWDFDAEDRAIPGETQRQRVKVRTYSPEYHRGGMKTIFGGTPYATQVDDADDVLRATFEHPRTAESLAEDMCHQFLRPDCPAVLVKNLAKTIRDADYNLLPAFRRIMMSQAMFAPDNRDTLIKHPVEMLIGFIRQTGYRLTVDEIDWWLDALDERPLDPNTVFGWNERALAGESYVLAWRNVALGIVNYFDNARLVEERGMNLHARFLSDNPSSMATIERVAATMNVPLNDAQKATIDQYLNFYQTTCQSWHVNQYRCTPGQLFLLRDPFDSFPQGDWEGKLRPLIGMLAMLPEYRLK